MSHPEQVNDNWCAFPQIFSSLTHVASLSSGGAELLFDGVKEHHVTLPGQSQPCEYANLPPGEMKMEPIVLQVILSQLLP